MIRVSRNETWLEAWDSSGPSLCSGFAGLKEHRQPSSNPLRPHQGGIHIRIGAASRRGSVGIESLGRRSPDLLDTPQAGIIVPTRQASIGCPSVSADCTSMGLVVVLWRSFGVALERKSMHCKEISHAVLIQAQAARFAFSNPPAIIRPDSTVPPRIAADRRGCSAHARGA
jgi:hypothetical protein